MAMSETPTNSLSLRLPVGVRATLSGFMAFYERGRETATAHCANGPRAVTPEQLLLSQSRRDGSRESGAGRIDLATVLAARAIAPAPRAVGFASFGRSRVLRWVTWAEQQIPPLRSG